MDDMLDQLKPIAAIIGPTGVKASYSGQQIWNARRGESEPGWEVVVDGTYKGAKVAFVREAHSLDDAASAALSQLKEALGLK